MAAHIDESVARAADVARRFSRHLQELEKIGADTHLKAINAIIKSDHLGSEGRTLEVLSQEMSAISRETDHFVLSMKRRLDQVADFAETFQGPSEDETAGGGGEIRIAKDGQGGEGEGWLISRNIEALSNDHCRLKEQVNGATTDADRLIYGIQNALDELVFLPELADEMTRHLDRLEIASATFQQVGNGNRADSSGARQLTGAYTMQRERDIHESIVAGQACGPETSAAGPSEDADPGYGENIRVEHLSGGEEKGAGVCEEDEALGENVELF
jgi:hypothetical protein